MRKLRYGIVAAIAGALCLTARGAVADAVTIRAAAHDGYGRIAFDWPAPVTFEVRSTDDMVAIRFARPVQGQIAAIRRDLAAYVASASLDDQGKTVVLHLKRPVAVDSFVNAATAVVDLRPAAAKPAPPPAAKALSSPAPAKPAPAPAPTDAASALPLVRLDASEKKGITRVTFGWPRAVGYKLSKKGGAARLVFRAAGAIDATALGRMLPGLAPAVAVEQGATIVTLASPAAAHLRVTGHAGAIALEARTAALATAAAQAASLQPASAPLAAPVVAAMDKPAPAPADAATPAPGNSAPPSAGPPPASVAVHFSSDNGIASLRFDWPVATAAAIFRRGGPVWVVFATPTTLDLSDPLAHGQQAIGAVTQIPNKGATVLKLEVQDGLSPAVRRAGTAWIIDLKPQPVDPDAPILVEANPSATPAMVAFRVHQASPPVTLADAEIGTLLVVPVGELGRGIAAPPQFVDFRALPSLQGIVLRPLSDDLSLTVGDDTVAVTRPNGLTLSGDRDRLLGHVPERKNALFDFSGWLGPSGVDYIDRRQALEHAIAAAAPGARTKPRLALAHFYFANLFAAETLAVLDAVARDDPQAANDPPVQALQGAACLLVDDLKCAADALGQHALDADPEARLWRGALAFEQHDNDAAARAFLDNSALLATYPKRLRMRFALAGATALIETGRGGLAAALTDLVHKDHPDPADEAMALYLDGRRAQQAGKIDDAIALWDRAAALGDRRAASRALYAKAVALFDSGRASRSATIKSLDALRYLWRGDDQEFTLLRRLGELQIADGDAENGIASLQEAATYFPDDPAAKDLAKETSDSFANLFLGPHGSDLPPLESLALYDQFHDLEPEGERRDQIVHKLIDRLVAVDLLDRAADLLDKQVNGRLTGNDKARGATQLALLRLMDHDPNGALKALDIDVGTDVQPDLARQRTQLRARVMMELGRATDALALLNGDQTRDADRLRADIYWHARDWKNAAETLARLAGPVPANGKIDAETGRLVISLAAALTLSDDRAGIANLRTQYGAALEGTSYANAFHILAGTGTDASGDPRALAQQVAQIGELQTFMASFKQELASGGDKVSAIN